MSIIPLPSFYAAFLVSALMLGLIVCWILLDPKFADAVQMGMIDLRLQPHPGFKDSIMDEIHDEMRSRIWPLGIVACLAIASSGWMLWRLFVGNPSGRSLAAMLMATALVAGWLCLFTQNARLMEYAIEWRIKRQMPQLAVLAKRLRADWPREDVEIPPFGIFRSDLKHPELLMSPDRESQPLPEKLGMFVRNHDGAIIFEFHDSTDKPWFIEFRADASMPRSFKDQFPADEEFSGFVNEYHFEETEALGGGVYFSRYSTRTRGAYVDELDEILTD